MRINIENILKSQDDIFDGLILKLTEHNINDSIRELGLKESGIDIVLFDAINLILKDIKNEENYISRLLYRIFKFEIKKSVRREQLIILGSQLKSQYIILKKDIYRINSCIANIDSSKKNLERLQKAFFNKNMFIFDQGMLQKSQFYIRKLVTKSRELESYQLSLKNRVDSLNCYEKSYRTLFKRIPRYHELQEDSYLQLSQ